MVEGIECLGHSTIKLIKNGNIIYIDPFEIKDVKNDADIIFITHSHYDHFSIEDINKIWNENTILIVTEDLIEKVPNYNEKSVIIVKPNEEYNVKGINFTTVPAYNTNKQFHPKSNNWVGYIIELDNVKYYIAGDTDINEDNIKVKCDVAFVPVGGVYTMTSNEAADLINIIKPKIAIPIHYGKIVGTKKDAEDFKNRLNNDIVCEILIVE